MSNNVPAIAFFELTDVEAGLSLETLSHATGIDGVSLQPALQTLNRHDVIEEVEGTLSNYCETFSSLGSTINSEQYQTQ